LDPDESIPGSSPIRQHRSRDGSVNDLDFGGVDESIGEEGDEEDEDGDYGIKIDLRELESQLDHQTGVFVDSSTKKGMTSVAT